LPLSFAHWGIPFLFGINCKSPTGRAGKGFYSRRV
jgi:hypothetical protein